MQVFKAFLRVMRSKLAVSLVFVGIFFIVGLMMTYSMSDEAGYVATSMSIVVNDCDNTPESRALVAFLGRNNKIIDSIEDEDTLTDVLYYEIAEYALTIPEGYARSLAAGETKELFEGRYMDYNYAVANLRLVLDKYVSTVQAYRATGLSSAEAIEAAETALGKETEVKLAHRDRKESCLGAEQGMFFRFLPYIILSVVLNTLCSSLVVMNRKEVRFRTDCSGIRPVSYLLQIYVAGGLFVLAVWFLFVSFGCVAGGSLYSGRSWLAPLNALLFAAFAAAFSLFVSEFAPKDNVTSVITQVIGLGMCFLCGVFVDQALLGSGVIAAARFLPAYWYIYLNRMLCGEIAFDTQEALTALAIQLVFAVVFILLAFVVRKARLHSTSPRKSAQTA